MDSASLTSGLIVVAALFLAAAALLTRLANSFLLVVLPIYAALLTCLLVLLRILAGQFMDALLASVKAAFFFHSLIAISIVRHVFFSPLVMVELKVMGLRERPVTNLMESTCMPTGDGRNPGISCVLGILACIKPYSKQIKLGHDLTPNSEGHCLQ